jgi:tetratricopeptide (TPR) repeat protein
LEGVDCSGNTCASFKCTAATQKEAVSKEDWSECDESGECARIIERTNISNSDRAVAYGLRCHWHANRQQLDAALDYCNRAIQADAEVSLGYEGRGYVRYMRNDWNGAIEDFSRAIALDPMLPRRTSYPFVSGKGMYKYYSYRSLSYRMLGNFASALSDAERSIALKPTAGAYGTQGLALESLNRAEEARSAYQRALTLAPNHATSKEGLARLEARSNGAIPEYCIALGPARPSGVGCTGGKQWYWTPVSIPSGRGCPSSIQIEYVDPESQKTETLAIPERLQTCGAGVTVARIRQ